MAGADPPPPPEIGFVKPALEKLGEPLCEVLLLPLDALSLTGVDPARVRVLATFVVGLVVFEALASSQLLPPLLAWPFAARVAAAVTLLAPLAMALGMPFPLGIRVVSARAPELVPWAWAVNGFLSVFSSIFCIVLAMSIGFTRVLLVAALVYGCGFLALTGLATRDTRTKNAAT